MNNNRKGFHDHRRATFGFLTVRIGRKYQLSAYSKKHPELYQMLINIGNQICPHPFSSIHVVKNLTCAPHRDKNNFGISTIMAIGSYTGGCLNIEGLGSFDTFENPVTFNGATHLHWNTDDLVGTKYSLIYFSCADSNGVVNYIGSGIPTDDARDNP